MTCCKTNSGDTSLTQELRTCPQITHPASRILHGSSGQMLVVVLWALGLVTIGVGTLSMRGVQELRAGRLDTELLEAEAAAQAAVVLAAAVIAEDEPSVDHLKEPWATGQDLEQEKLPMQDAVVGRARYSIGVERADGTFAVGMIDEERRLNVNAASPASLARLIELLQADGPHQLGGLAPGDIAAAIADWRVKPFETVDELLLVPGMTPALAAAMRPHVTVAGLGTVNVNTADELVLQAAGLNASQMAALLAQRQAAPLTSVPSAFPAGLGVQSSHFEVPVVATVSGSAARVRRSAVIDRSGVIRSWSYH